MQLVSCKSTRWLEPNDYLLKKNSIEIDNKTIDKRELESYYRQVPNKKFLVFFKFRLSTYNFSKLGKERKFKLWIRRVIGEEPAIYDSIMVEQTRDQFLKALKNEAYYDAVVDYKVELHNKRAWVDYTITAGNPIIINKVTYEIEDSILEPLVFSDTLNSFLIPGKRMTLKSLENERKRIVTQMRDSGYFEFNMDYIKYRVDTLRKQANITLLLKMALQQDSLNNVTEQSHKKYWINTVHFLPDFDPQKANRNRREYFSTFDTTCAILTMFAK
jgi:hypothetical protein